MKLLVERESEGTIVIDEFRNDHDAIADAVKENRDKIQELYDDVVRDFTNERWNAYIQEYINTLVGKGWEVIYV